jgi:hypothetical protein
MGLRALFNSALGFELVDCGMSSRLNGVFSQEAVEYLKGKPIAELYCYSEILCKKARDVIEFDWNKIEIDQIVRGTRVPASEIENGLVACWNVTLRRRRSMHEKADQGARVTQSWRPPTQAPRYMRFLTGVKNISAANGTYSWKSPLLNQSAER